MAEETLQNKKILYIEDDTFLADLIIKKLESLGADVTNVATGEQALDELKAQKPDTILLDLLLPEMSGFEFLEKIKNDSSTQNIPVVIFSNLGQEENVERADELGVDRFLVKANVVPDEIPGVVEEIIGHDVQQGRERAQQNRAENDGAAQPAAGEGEQTTESRNDPLQSGQ